MGDDGTSLTILTTMMLSEAAFHKDIGLSKYMI